MGPRATPPPTHWGERVEPGRARPVPFWRNGLAPPPRTSARVLVDWVPERAAASWAVTTWWSTARLGSMPKSDGLEVDLTEVGPVDRAAGHRPLLGRGPEEAPDLGRAGRLEVDGLGGGLTRPSLP